MRLLCAEQPCLSLTLAADQAAASTAALRASAAAAFSSQAAAAPGGGPMADDGDDDDDYDLSGDGYECVATATHTHTHNTCMFFCYARIILFVWCASLPFTSLSH